MDTSLHIESIPESQMELCGRINIIWTGLEYGYQPDIWIMKGIIVNGTDSNIVLPIKYGQVDMILIRDTTPLTTEGWCGTFNKLKQFSRATMPPRSIFRFAIPGETGRKYSVVLETRDLYIKSEEITIDQWSDNRIEPIFDVNKTEIKDKMKVGYTKRSGTRISK